MNTNEADLQSFSLYLQVDHVDFLMPSFVHRVYKINTLLFVPFLTALHTNSHCTLLRITSVYFSSYLFLSYASLLDLALFLQSTHCETEILFVLHYCEGSTCHFASQKVFVRNILIFHFIYIHKNESGYDKKEIEGSLWGKRWIRRSSS